MPSIGEQLKQARLAKKWTPQAASKSTKIRPEQLLELENDSYGGFASPAYARGFVRLYARALGLDERKIAAQLDGKLEDYDEPSGLVVAPPVEYIPEGVVMRPKMEPKQLGSLVAYGLLFLIAGIVAMQIYHAAAAGMSRKKAPVADAPDGAVSGNEKTATGKAADPKKAEPVAPKATAVGPVAPEVRAAVPVQPEVRKAEPAPGQHRLSLEVSEDCWVRVSAVNDGETRELFADVIPAGQTRDFDATKFALTVAIPAAVKIRFDGVDYGTYSNDRTPAEFAVPAE